MNGISRRNFIKTCGCLAAGSIFVPGIAGCSFAQKNPTVHDYIQRIISKMTVEEKVAQLFIVTPQQVSGTELVTQIDEGFCNALRAMPVAGLIYFSSNLINSEQTSALLSSIQNIATEAGLPPFFMCIDEEGGKVQRIGGKPGFDLPAAANASAIGATGDIEIARESARTIAVALRDLGFNVDFAPSCEIAPSKKSNMYKRSFGADAMLVSQMITAQIQAFTEEGILCCAKHFPGIGDPEEDSHNLSIFSNKTREELAYQLEPFKAAIAANVPLIMMGHLALPQITGSAIPSSISPDIVQGILRDELGYNGVVTTDSLSMKALLKFCSPEDVAVAAVEAGCDVALMPPDLNAAYKGLLDAANTERISIERIDESLARILSLKVSAFPEYLASTSEDFKKQA